MFSRKIGSIQFTFFEPLPQRSYPAGIEKMDNLEKIVSGWSRVVSSILGLGRELLDAKDSLDLVRRFRSMADRCCRKPALSQLVPRTPRPDRSDLLPRCWNLLQIPAALK